MLSATQKGRAADVRARPLLFTLFDGRLLPGRDAHALARAKRTRQAGREAAVDGQVDARDEAALVRREEQVRVRHIEHVQRLLDNRRLHHVIHVDEQRQRGARDSTFGIFVRALARVQEELHAQQKRPRGARSPEAHREAPYVVEMQRD